MGYDAYIHIDKHKFNRTDVENLIEMLGYHCKKNGNFYCGNDPDYKYNMGITIWKEDDDNEHDEWVYHVRMPIWAGGHDIKKANDTIRAFRKYCSAWFTSDKGKNRYFDEENLIEGAENGCYIVTSRVLNEFFVLEISLQTVQRDGSNMEILREFGKATPEIFTANVYASYLCTLMEEFFRSLYMVLLRYSDKKENIYNVKLSPFDLMDMADGTKSLEEVYARTLSFQNIQKIVSHFQKLDNRRIDIGAPLKKPYHNRKMTLYDQVNEIFERRHSMVHHNEIDLEYNIEKLTKDIKDIKEAFTRVYNYLCTQNGWDIRDVS